MTDTRSDAKFRQQFPTGCPPTLNVAPWPDPTIDTHGHRPGSPYIEAVWLGILGPSTTLAWSRLSRIATAQPGAAVDITDLSISLGLSAHLGRNAPITRTLSRMVMFGAATRSGDTLAVRRALPDVPERMASRLSYTAQLAHRRWAHLGPQGATAAGVTPRVGMSL